MRIMDLTLLAPDIQEEILHLEAVDGRQPASGRMLREVVRHQRWAEQRAAWRSLVSQGGTGTRSVRT